MLYCRDSVRAAEERHQERQSHWTACDTRDYPNRRDAYNARGKGLREVARQFGVGVETVRRCLTAA
jgi:hypothetical protein